METEREENSLFDEALRLERCGQWEQAVLLYEQVIDKWGDQPEGLYAKNSAARLRTMPANASKPREHPQGERMRSTSLTYKSWSHRGIRVSVGGALALIIWDAVLSGSFLASFVVCPIWFLISILKNAIQCPGWRLALLRIATPVLTLALVMANDAFQYKIGNANASKIVAACEKFHSANGRFPKTLDELVPGYLPSVPRAKYCLVWGEFWYLPGDDKPLLTWWVVPPYGRKVYNFERRRWGYLD